jgi:hypothetical protein
LLFRLRPPLGFLASEVEGQLYDLASQAPIVGEKSEIGRLRHNMLFLLSLAIPLNILAQKLNDLGRGRALCLGILRGCSVGSNREKKSKCSSRDSNF